MQALLLLALGAAPQDDLTTRTYDLRAILASRAQVVDSLNHWWQLPSIDEIYAAEMASDPDEEISLDLRTCSAIATIVADGAPGGVLEDLREEEDRFVVTANAAAHASIEAALDSVEGAAIDGVLVEAFRIDGALLGDDRVAVLTSERAGAVAARAEDASRTLGHAQFGRLTVVGRETRTQYVQDYDVEVSQFASVIDPTVNRAFLGMKVRVRLDRSHDGRSLIARVWGRSSSMERGMRRRALQAFANSVIEHPIVDAEQFMASGTIEPGGALVMDTGHPDGHVVVVRFHAEIQARSDRDPMVDFGWLLTPPQRRSPLILPEVNPSRGLDPSDEEILEWTNPWTDDRPNLFTLLGRMLGEDTSARAVRVGSGAIVACEDSERRELRDAIQRRARAGRVSTLEITSAHLEVTRSDLVRAMTAAETLAQLCDAAPVQRIGSVFAEDTLLLAGGTLSRHVQDHDVQIGGGVSAGDPIVKSTFDGGALWCSPVRVANDRILVWFDAAHQQGLASARLFETFLSSPATGSPSVNGLSGADLLEHFERFVLKVTLELGSTRRIHGRALLELTPGQWRILAAQPYDGDESVQLIAVKARIAGP